MSSTARLILDTLDKMSTPIQVGRLGYQIKMNHFRLELFAHMWNLLLDAPNCSGREENATLSSAAGWKKKTYRGGAQL